MLESSLRKLDAEICLAVVKELSMSQTVEVIIPFLLAVQLFRYSSSLLQSIVDYIRMEFTYGTPWPYATSAVSYRQRLL